MSKFSSRNFGGSLVLCTCSDCGEQELCGRVDWIGICSDCVNKKAAAVAASRLDYALSNTKQCLSCEVE